MSNNAQDRLAKMVGKVSPIRTSNQKAKTEGVARQAGKGGGTPLPSRQNAVGQVASGKKRMAALRLHPTSRIRTWHGHNRDYEKLSVDRCKDLIEGFKRATKQEFPAVVRKVTDSDDFDYEVICGARRHWTAAYLEWDLLIEVRDLTDKAAFILQDIENRDREDVSDYERACDYAAALPLYFENRKDQMANFLEIDNSNFGKLLDLAQLPSAIVDAYKDVRDLKTHHGVEYRKLMKDPAAKKRILTKAASLAIEPLPGKLVIAELRKSASGKAAPNKFKPRQYGGLTLVRQSQNGKMAIDWMMPSDESAIQALKDDFAELIDSVVTKKN